MESQLAPHNRLVFCKAIGYPPSRKVNPNQCPGVSLLDQTKDAPAVLPSDLLPQLRRLPVPTSSCKACPEGNPHLFQPQGPQPSANQAQAPQTHRSLHAAVPGTRSRDGVWLPSGQERWAKRPQQPEPAALPELPAEPQPLLPVLPPNPQASRIKPAHIPNHSLYIALILLLAGAIYNGC